jgi:hypothetical protein
VAAAAARHPARHPARVPREPLAMPWARGRAGVIVRGWIGCLGSWEGDGSCERRVGRMLAGSAQRCETRPGCLAGPTLVGPGASLAVSLRRPGDRMTSDLLFSEAYYLREGYLR